MSIAAMGAVRTLPAIDVDADGAVRPGRLGGERQWMRLDRPMSDDGLAQSIDGREATVVGLFFGCRPTAVAGFVIAIVVNAVKAMKRAWASSHISDEIDIRCPAFAAGNSATSVSIIASVPWIVAPFAHGAPNSPFRSFVRFSVYAEKLAKCFPSEASARASLPISQGSARTKKFLSAIAFDAPFHMSVRVGEGNQSAEPLTRDIDEFGHCLLLQRAVVSSSIRARPTLGCCAIIAAG